MGEIVDESGASPAPLLDLDIGDLTPPASALEPSIRAIRYDPVQATDNARKNIAYSLLAILAGIVIISFLAFCLTLDNSQAGAKDNYDHFLAVLNIVYGPIVTLVGSATGFYFGSQSRAPQQSNLSGSGT
jgi:hypothetical protein